MSGSPEKAPDKTPETAEELPPFSEQLSSQLGGIRGLVESGIPVVVFVLGNVVLGALKVENSLNYAITAAVISALSIAAYRLYRRESIRHAMNGLFGIAIGAVLAWKTGNAKDFYLPGIFMHGIYAAALLASVIVNKPAIGYAWSVISNGGRKDWIDNPALVRTFRWVTCGWAGLFLFKGGIQLALYLAQDVDATVLGIVRLALGYPPWLLGVAFTAWVVRRTTRRLAVSTEANPA